MLKSNKLSTSPNQSLKELVSFKMFRKLGHEIYFDVTKQLKPAAVSSTSVKHPFKSI